MIQRDDPFEGALGFSLATRVGLWCTPRGWSDSTGATASVPSDLEDDRAQFYEALGVTATYDSHAHQALLEVALPRSAKSCRRGDTLPDPTSALAG